MNKIQKRIQLLSLFSIYFIYKAITSKTPEEVAVWTMITIVYLLSIVIMIIITNRMVSEYDKSLSLSKEKIKFFFFKIFSKLLFLKVVRLY